MNHTGVPIIRTYIIIFISTLIIFTLLLWQFESLVFSSLAAMLHLGTCILVFRSAKHKQAAIVSPAVIWLTGLSGAGKTTIAQALASKLQQEGIKPVLLDGDEIREAVRLHGFDEASRKQHNKQVGYIASLFEKNGHLVIVSLISPYQDVRDEIRKMCRSFMEVYVSTPLETCMQRDPKGLYKKALAGEIGEFTGISSPYDTPKNPELKLDTSKTEPEDCARKILFQLSVVNGRLPANN